MGDQDEQWLAQLRKGSLEMCMLALLADGERYGYEVARGLGDSGELAVGEGTIYPLLSRLAREGLVSSRWGESPAGPPRKYYALTAEGRKALETKISAWQSFSRAVNGVLREGRNGKHRT